MPTDLRITNARAAELAALDKAATPGPWRTLTPPLRGEDIECGVEARNALADLLADRAVLIAAVARARRYIEMAGWPQSHDDDRASLMADLGTLLARAEGRDA